MTVNLFKRPSIFDQMMGATFLSSPVHLEEPANTPMTSFIRDTTQSPREGSKVSSDLFKRPSIFDQMMRSPCLPSPVHLEEPANTPMTSFVRDTAQSPREGFDGVSPLQRRLALQELTGSEIPRAARQYLAASVFIKQSIPLNKNPLGVFGVLNQEFSTGRNPRYWWMLYSGSTAIGVK